MSFSRADAARLPVDFEGSLGRVYAAVAADGTTTRDATVLVCALLRFYVFDEDQTPTQLLPYHDPNPHPFRRRR